MTQVQGATLTLAERKRLVEIKNISGSTEPYRLYVKRSGVFLRSFETEVAMTNYLAKLPVAQLKPTTRTTRRR